MTSRDLVGYGDRPPFADRPGHARIAVQFVLNIEEGAEACVLDGDARSESYLHELPVLVCRREQIATYWSRRHGR